MNAAKSHGGERVGNPVVGLGLMPFWPCDWLIPSSWDTESRWDPELVVTKKLSLRNLNLQQPAAKNGKTHLYHSISKMHL